MLGVFSQGSHNSDLPWSCTSSFGTVGSTKRHSPGDTPTPSAASGGKEVKSTIPLIWHGTNSREPSSASLLKSNIAQSYHGRPSFWGDALVELFVVVSSWAPNSQHLINRDFISVLLAMLKHLCDGCAGGCVICIVFGALHSRSHCDFDVLVWLVYFFDF